MTGISRQDIEIYLLGGYSIVVHTAASARALLLTAQIKGFSYPHWWDTADHQRMVPFAVTLPEGCRKMLSMRDILTIRRNLVEFNGTSSDFMY